MIADLAPAAVFVYAPLLQSLLGAAPPPAHALVLLLVYPLVVWRADELRRLVLRRCESRLDASTAASAA